MLEEVHSERRYGVAIKRKDGSECMALASPCGPALFYQRKEAAEYKRELGPHFKCRVVPLIVTIEEDKS